jgi:antitoxin (DNA-binding transcriptional repressor) of toxin-antitoxin stability system
MTSSYGSYLDIVATGSYYDSMNKLKTVGIKELKNNLSYYVREVRAGSSILVTDRNDIVAELHAPYGRPALPGQSNPVLLSWAEADQVTLPALEKQPLEISPVRRPAGTAKSLLDSDRRESGD